MPTPAERQALAFLALVAALGGAARLVQARAFERALDRAGLPGSSDGLVQQAAAVDSARAAVAERAAASPPRGAGRPGRSEGTRGRPAARDAPPAPDPVIVNPDLASAEELDALPGVGPALAARIVANRDSLGPFGSLEALQRVRGIGPATAERLAAHVTFSPGFRPLHGTTRPPVRPR
ncbi:MAG TPA: helix-hairpin-helix domain-containing protein [Gemmatimonadaceae bacterium]|nr:helix-hairpin-helix domain-containing protein [Gemmatimonadaceae bacterium]